MLRVITDPLADRPIRTTCHEVVRQRVQRLELPHSVTGRFNAGEPKVERGASPETL